MLQKITAIFLGQKTFVLATHLWEYGSDLLMHVTEEVDVGVAGVAAGRPVLA